MNVKESEGERMVFMVQSASVSARWYRCDLLFNGGYGQCACIDWSTRRWPNIRKGHAIGTRETLCRHLIEARRYFLNDLIRTLAQQEQE